MANDLIIDTNITDAWGVDWDEMETARDFLQNFYDANDVEDIKIDIHNSEVKISAPAAFDYQQLIYFGSDKAGDNSKIGQYGEGWKASVLNALRNFGCKVSIVINNKSLEFYFEEKKIGKTIKRVIFCRVKECKSIPGSTLFIQNCTQNLIEQFRFGLGFFYFKQNPLFGDFLASENGLEIYKSRNEKGYVFYKKLLRATIDLPLVVVYNQPIKKVDNRIQHDRDRKAFNDEVLTKMLEGAFSNITTRSLEPVILHLREFWRSGHKILKILSTTRKWNDKYKIEFPLEFYAKEHIDNRELIENQIEINKLIYEFQRLGYICCPRYMAEFGMKTPDGIIKQKNLERQEKLTKIYSRKLTTLEKRGIEILSDFIGKMSPQLQHKFENAKYTLGESDEIIGELKKKRNYKEEHVFLNKIFFQLSFSDAISILIHEWSHIFGYDGSRTFSDALTEFIALILEKENLLSEIKNYQLLWQNQCEKIKEERKKNSSHFYDLIDTLELNQLTGILKTIPEDELYQILERAKII